MNKYMVSWGNDGYLAYGSGYFENGESGSAKHFLIEADSREEAGIIFLDSMYDLMIEKGLKKQIYDEIEKDFIEESIEGFYIDGLTDKENEVFLAELSGKTRQSYDEILLSFGIVKTQMMMQDGKIQSIMSKEDMTERQKEAFMEDFIEEFHKNCHEALFEHLSENDCRNIWFRKMQYDVEVIPLSEKIMERRKERISTF